MQHLSLTTMVVRSDGFIEAQIDNEVVALNIEKGACYGLNTVGSIASAVATPRRRGS
jgi:hypothetical protein